MRSKFYTTIEDTQAPNGLKQKEVRVEIKEGLAGYYIEIKPEGFGDHGSADGHGVPITLELYEGRLRLIVFPNINNENPTVIDMEGARETARKKGKRIIESKCLPYFQDDGLVNIFNRETGQRVFVKKKNFKDITTDGGRMHGLFKFEITEE